MTVLVPVTFSGTVEVNVPDDTPPQYAKAMAQKVALSHILATTENPDAPDEEAFEEMVEETEWDEDDAGSYWDAVICSGVSGCWQLEERPDHRQKEQL